MKSIVIEKTKAGLRNVRGKLAVVNTAILVAMPMMAAASDEDKAEVSGTDAAKNNVNTLLGLVLDVIGLFGGFLLVSGVFKLFMAYRTDNPEGQSAAAKDVVIGVVICGFRLFAWPTIKKMI